MNEHSNSGMMVSVYRDSSIDCTNGGISSKYDHFIVLGMEGPFTPNEKTPALRLVKRYISGIGDYYHLAPLDCGGEHHYMFGGNFAFTSDSRFGKISRYPLPIHDLAENFRG